MAGTQGKTRRIHPLRRVEHIDVSEEMGADLGNPHYFWLDRRYTMTLECGHEQARVKFNHEHLPPEEFMPKRVRCKDCPRVSVPTRKRPSPKYDHLASTLVGAILGASDSGDDEGIALAWVQEEGTWIEDERVRARTYGSVALFLLDTMLDDKTVRYSSALRNSIEEWAHDPKDRTKSKTRKNARRLYNAQHAPGNDWLAARALICLGRITSMGSQSARGVVEALTWDRESREGFYERLWMARYRVDTHAPMGLLVAGVEADPGDREERLREISESMREAREELSRVWHEEYPEVGVHHLPLLMHLLEVFSEGKQEARESLTA